MCCTLPERIYSLMETDTLLADTQCRQESIADKGGPCLQNAFCTSAKTEAVCRMAIMIITAGDLDLSCSTCQWVKMRVTNHVQTSPSAIYDNFLSVQSVIVLYSVT